MLSVFPPPRRLELAGLPHDVRHEGSYVDCATNSVRQTVALAHPDTPASELYEMARSIEAKITLRSTDWFKFKSIPT